MINTEILREYDIRGIYQKSLNLEDVQNIAKKISNRQLCDLDDGDMLSTTLNDK